MCFCFDGENALRSYRPDDCRDRQPAANARVPGLIVSHAEPEEQDAGSFGDVGHSRHLAVLLEQMY